jgi:signal transduction histidine kinase
MRRRLRITFMGLIACVVLGLAIPLALALAARSAQTMYIDRLNDAERFASLAEPALLSGRVAALSADLTRYDAVFGIPVTVVARDGHPVIASRSGWDAGDPAVAGPLQEALAGRQLGLEQTFWPWRHDPMVVAVPVTRDGEVVAAVVTISPTDALGRETGVRIGIVAALGCLALGVGNLATRPLARWLLRPVERLDLAAAAMAEGRFSDRVDVGSGPPELRRLAMSFNHMADRVVALLDRQRSFVSYASHQLRTPLATLRLSVENLADAVGPHGLTEYRSVADEIDRLGHLCDALLTYARAEATAADQTQTVDAVSTVEERLSAWRTVAQRAGVTLSRVGRPSALTGVTARALDQALDALLSNSVKFAGPGAHVVVSVESAGQQWVDIHVVDDGPGLADEDLARASEAFWRRPNDQNIDGTGLGITIAEALVTASGGRFALANAQPHGLDAWIRLPASPATTMAGV